MTLNKKSFYERPRFYKGLNSRIMFPTSHDIFPEHIEDTIKYLRGWLGAGNSFLIVSKPRLECIRRLCDDLKEFKDQITFRFTIGSSDDAVLSFWEPDAPCFMERMNSLIHAYQMGYKTSVSCEPYLDNKIALMVEKILPLVTDTVWIGKMNDIKRRVDTQGWTRHDFVFLDRIKECQTDGFVTWLYNEFKDNKKVRWKDSIKRVVGLPEEEIG